MRGLPSSSSEVVQPTAAAVPQLALERSGPAGSAPVRRVVGSTFTCSAAVALAIFIGSAARVLPPLLAGAIQQDLEWLDSEITWPVAISVAISALAAPLATIGLDRFGVRSLLLATLVFLAISLALSSLATSPWHLLLFWGVGVGLSGSLSASILGAVIGFHDYAAHCGTTFGLFTSTQFFGSAAGLLLASRATDALGWRFVLNAGATATLVAALAVALVLHGWNTGAAPETGVCIRPRPLIHRWRTFSYPFV